MSAPQALPILMPAVAGQRWSCHSCGQCCRSLVGHLFEEDRQRIDQQNWADELGVAPYVRLGRGWALNKTTDEACVFLDEAGLCRIHKKYGETAKPLACRIFPFSVRPVRRGWQVSLRFDCPSVTSSKGNPIAERRPWLSELVRSLHDPHPSKDDLAELGRRLDADADEIDALMSRFRHWLTRHDVSFLERLVGAARVTTTLQGATFAKVRGRRFAELLDLLFRSLPSECAVPPPNPSDKQRGLLRQFAFAHAEHVTLAAATAGPLARLRTRLQQLRRARAFLVGRGPAPRLPGLDGETTFEAIEAVQPPTGGHDISDLLLRYIIARLAGRSCFGEGYYGWPIFSGLGALWLAIAAMGWLARYAAALAGRTELSFDDVARALGIVDRAATRLPALGTVAERARMAYCFRGDGLARLTRACCMVGDTRT